MAKKTTFKPLPPKTSGKKHTATGILINKNGNPINQLTKSKGQTREEYDAARIPSMKRHADV